MCADIDDAFRNDVEKELQRTTERLDSARKIVSRILQAESPQAIAEIALEHMERIVPSRLSTISLFRSDYSVAVLLASRHDRMVPGEIVPVEQIYVEILKEDRAIVVNDLAALRKHTAAQKALLESGGRTLLSVPLLTQEELIGAISLIDDKPDAFSEQDIQTIQQVGNNVAIAIQNSRLLEKEKKARREAETLREAAATLNASLDQDELLDQILAQLELVLPFDRATIFLQQKETGLAMANHRGREIQLPELFPMIKEIPANILMIIDEKQPAIIPDTHNDPNWVVFPGGEFIHCWMGIPLVTKDSFIGLLMLDKKETHFYSVQDASLALAFANHAAVAIENANLLENERTARREAETLREITGSMNASLEQEDLLSLILTQLKRVVSYDSATILLFENNSLIPVAQQGISVPRIEILRQLEQLPPNVIRLSLDHQPQIIADTREDPEWITFPGTEFIRSWMGIPLLIKEQFIGLLMLDYSEPDFYKEHDATTALAFANHAATAIENAKLYGEVRQYAEVLETHVTERTRELGALYEITAISSQHLELQETLDQMVAVTAEALDCRTVTIQLLDSSGSELHLAAYKNLSPPMVAYMQSMQLDHFAWREVIEQKEASVVSILPTDPRFSEVPIPSVVSYAVVAPIHSKGKVLGILGIATNKAQPPSREDLALLTSIADHIGVAVENARLRQQSEKLAVLQERERLARDLHDSATQSLFTLTLFAAAAREHLSKGQTESVTKQLVGLEETAVQTHKEMRLMLYELRPTVLEKEGLEEALRQRMQMVEIRSGIRGQVTAILSSKLPFSVELALYQVANEALNNALKHSGADTVTINIVTDDTTITMKITDNGQGFTIDDADFTPGLGIEGMRQRVEQLGGTFHHEPELISGTTLVIQIPLGQAEPASKR